MAYVLKQTPILTHKKSVSSLFYSDTEFNKGIRTASYNRSHSTNCRPQVTQNGTTSSTFVKKFL